MLTTVLATELWLSVGAKPTGMCGFCQPSPAHLPESEGPSQPWAQGTDTCFQIKRLISVT